MFKKLEDDGMLLDTISSLGWGFWPMNKDGKYTGYLDEGALRALADEIERRNKPFWDEYNKYCEDLEKSYPVEEFEDGDVISAEPFKRVGQ